MEDDLNVNFQDTIDKLVETVNQNSEISGINDNSQASISTIEKLKLKKVLINLLVDIGIKEY